MEVPGLGTVSSSSRSCSERRRIFGVDAAKGSGLRGVVHLHHLGAIRSVLTPYLPPPGLQNTSQVEKEKADLQSFMFASRAALRRRVRCPEKGRNFLGLVGRAAAATAAGTNSSHLKVAAPHVGETRRANVCEEPSGTSDSCVLSAGENLMGENETSMRRGWSQYGTKIRAAATRVFRRGVRCKRRGGMTPLPVPSPVAERN